MTDLIRFVTFMVTLGYHFDFMSYWNYLILFSKVISPIFFLMNLLLFKRSEIVMRLSQKPRQPTWYNQISNRGSLEGELPQSFLYSKF